MDGLNHFKVGSNDHTFQLTWIIVGIIQLIGIR